MRTALGITNGTTFPASPNDGDIHIYPADTTNGVEWMFRYRAAASSNKWEFIGGAPLRAEVITEQSTTSTSYTDLTTAGPTVTNPLAGDYDIAIGYATYNTTSAANTRGAINGTANQIETLFHNEPSGGNTQVESVMTKYRKTGLSASTALKLQYKVSSGTGSFFNRFVEVLPVRVSG